MWFGGVAVAVASDVRTCGSGGFVLVVRGGVVGVSVREYEGERLGLEDGGGGGWREDVGANDGNVDEYWIEVGEYVDTDDGEGAVGGEAEGLREYVEDGAGGADADAPTSCSHGNEVFST